MIPNAAVEPVHCGSGFSRVWRFVHAAPVSRLKPLPQRFRDRERR